LLRRRRLLSILLLSALLLASPGASADPFPFVLPAGEQVEDWELALALVSLRPVRSGGGDDLWIELAPGQPGWALQVHGASGLLRTVDVEPPRTASDREGIALLAFSLLQPGAVSTPPEVAPHQTDPPAPPQTDPPAPPETDTPSDTATAEGAPPEPETTDPAPTAVSPTFDEPLPESSAPAEEPVPLEPAPMEVREAAPDRLDRAPHPWGLARVAVDLRPGLDAGLRLGAGAGVGLRGWRVGLVGEGRLPGNLAGETDRDVWELGGAAAVAWTPLRPTSPVLELRAGVAARSFREGGEPVAVVATPAVSLRGGVSLTLGGLARLEPSAAVSLDLRRTWLVFGDAEPLALVPVSFHLGATLSVIPPEE